MHTDAGLCTYAAGEAVLRDGGRLGSAGQTASPHPALSRAQLNVQACPFPPPPGTLRTAPIPTHGSQPESIPGLPGSDQISEILLQCNTRMSPWPKSLVAMPPGLQVSSLPIAASRKPSRTHQGACGPGFGLHYFALSTSPMTGVGSSPRTGFDSCLCPLPALTQAPVPILPPRKILSYISASEAAANTSAGYKFDVAKIYKGWCLQNISVTIEAASLCDCPSRREQP